MQYDALEAPDPSEWLALDEAERILLVRSHHESAGIEMPNVLLHAAFHVAVENQIAMGDENPVRRALERLMAEELDRHEAIHAIGSVLAAHIHAIAKRTDHGTDPNAAYYRELESLTAEGWRKARESDDSDDG